MKYKLTKEKKEVCGITLYRIQALKDFDDVKKGDKGGWIEKEGNLSQDNNAWVYGDAWVHGDAWVYGNAQVYGDAEVCGNTRVYDNAEVYDNAWVHGNTRVYGNAQVYGDVWVHGNAWVYGELKLRTGWCFARKREDWDVTELKNGEEILLIKDYKPVKEDDEVEIIVDGNSKMISRKSAKALNLI